MSDFEKVWKEFFESHGDSGLSTSTKALKDMAKLFWEASAERTETLLKQENSKNE